MYSNSAWPMRQFSRDARLGSCWAKVPTPVRPTEMATILALLDRKNQRKALSCNAIRINTCRHSFGGLRRVSTSPTVPDHRFGRQRRLASHKEHSIRRRVVEQDPVGVWGMGFAGVRVVW
jgi:hypothetical protein